MTPEQRAAYIFSQSVCAFVEALGMDAENKNREVAGFSPAYAHEQFMEVLDRYGVHHNAVERKYKIMSDSSYYDGMRRGITLYAWWKDGVQYVGAGIRTLKKALEEVDKLEYSYEHIGHEPSGIL